jgi:hypothetical protein
MAEGTVLRTPENYSARAGPHVTYAPETLAPARAYIAASGAEPFRVSMLVGTYSAIAAGFMGRTVQVSPCRSSSVADR